MASDPFIKEQSREDTPRQDLGKGCLVNHLPCMFLRTAQVMAHLSIPKTQSHSQELFAVDLGRRGPRFRCCLPAAHCDSHGLWPILAAGSTLCQVPLPRISCPTWPQHRQLCGSGQSEWQQLFLVPWGGQDRGSRGSILMALSLASARDEGKPGNGDVILRVRPPTKAPGSHASPVGLQELNLPSQHRPVLLLPLTAEVMESHLLQPRSLSLMAT